MVILPILDMATLYSATGTRYYICPLVGGRRLGHTLHVPIVQGSLRLEAIGYSMNWLSSSYRI